MNAHAIRTARVPARLSRRHAVRPALERWLADAQPARHGLPPQAIVLVRRLQARWNSVASSDHAIRYEPLGALLARAARPALGATHGDVVWFADEAELLACLARAASAGELLLHWWWKLALGDPSPAGVRREWLRRAERVPRALQRMERSQAGAWIGSWTPVEQHQLVVAIAQVFPVAPEVVTAVLATVPDPGPPVMALPPPQAPATRRGGARHLDGEAPRERICRLLLALAADPMAAIDALPWTAAPPAPRRNEDAPSAAVAARASAPAAPPWRSGAANGEADGPVARSAPTRRNARGRAGSEAVIATQLATARASAGPPSGEAHESLPTVLPPPEPAASAPVVAVPTSWRIATRFGGVLFLLNAALQLGLYGDFTQPRHPGTLRCSPWRFLLASGRIFGGAAFARDPLAAWLRARAPRPPADRPRRPGLWLALRAHLLRALELEQASQLAGLLQLDAQVQDAGERVDVHMDLAGLPIAIRLAGLDRDCGWIPAAGCDLRFHFD